METGRRARANRLSGGSHAQMAAAPSAFNAPSTRNDQRQEECAATSAEMVLPLNPPSTVPVTYAAMAAAGPSFHSSLM